MDIYFVQSIDNSRLVRVADPRRRRELHMLLATGACLFVLLFAWTWQRYRIVQLGYQLQAVRVQQANLDQWNRGLRLEEAALRDPQRIYTLASGQLGMRPAQPEQISALENGPAPARNAPAEASLQTPRRSMITAVNATAPPNER